MTSSNFLSTSVLTITPIVNINQTTIPTLTQYNLSSSPQYRDSTLNHISTSTPPNVPLGPRKDFGVTQQTLANTTNATDIPIVYPHHMLGFTAASAFLIAIFGTAGNILTIVALSLCKKLRTTATALVINLAVVEGAFCIIILPMSGAHYLYLQKYTLPLFSNKDCFFFTTARFTLTQVELQTILAIALTRALAVSCPQFYQKINNFKFINIYIGIIWVYSFLLKLPITTGLFGSYSYNNHTMECDLSKAKSKMDAYVRLTTLVIEALLPIIIIIGLYIFIFVKVLERCRKRACRLQPQRKKKTMKTTSVITTLLHKAVRMSTARVSKSSSIRLPKSKNSLSPSSASTSTNSPNAPQPEENTLQQEQKQKPRKGSMAQLLEIKSKLSEYNVSARFTRRSSSLTQRLVTSSRDLRVARTIFVIFVMVFVCSLPVALIHLFDKQASNKPRFLALHVLYWLQYSLNVVVYVLMNKQYRDAYVDCLARVLPSCKRHQGFIFPWESHSMASRPAVVASSSFKGIRKESYRQDSVDGISIMENPSACKEPKSFNDATTLPKTGRLSAIPEANTSSCISDEDTTFGIGKPGASMPSGDNDEVQNTKTKTNTEGGDQEQNNPSEFLLAKSDQEKSKSLDSDDHKEISDAIDEVFEVVTKHCDEQGDEEEKEVWILQNGTPSGCPMQKSIVV